MNVQINHLLGLAGQFIENSDLEKANQILGQALKLAPKNTEVFRLLGIVFALRGRLNQALEMFERSIRIEPNNWLSHNGRGNVLKELKQYGFALKSYDRSIALNPDYPGVYNNKGNLIYELGDYEASIHWYDKALFLQSSYADALHGKGNALKRLGLFLDALACYEEARKFKPKSGQMLSSSIGLKMQLCEWSDLKIQVEQLYELGVSSPEEIHPFNLLSIFDDPEFILKLTHQYMLSKHPSHDDLGPTTPRAGGAKIRIGYFSPDFRNHAVSFLIAGMIEAHTKSRFESIAFSMGLKGKSDDMRARLQSGFDEFIDISAKTDLEVAKLAREMNIDIAIDLGGLTQDARPSIFAYRTAPIQIGYIGYLGSLAAPYMDYIISDKTIIPKELQDAYSEKIIYLSSYQANDPKRKMADKIFSREELGLPSHGFIYCCFNNNYKITPSIVDSWALILKSVDESVIFLYAENPTVRNNLLKEFQARGVQGNRIIFAEHLPRDEYLARYQIADLFLDTSPYNAGTTASDALWAGLPVLTFTGKSFASRMGGSILNAIGLPELIAKSQNEYELIAIALGKDPKRMCMIKEKLAKNRLTTPLFDLKIFVKNLEAAYESIYARCLQQLVPEHIN
ncbi:O-linked N-acetylglucosamine transferase family protein [Polynucleobacter sp.]|uniref:O-linked N-acetylglucosamine transferase, SPINDLY family protein n=1 Tax=Polynucleobacter sp. TaxID=2029855 RepID=UPI003F6A23BF